MREKILVPCLDVMELIQYGRRIGKKVYCEGNSLFVLIFESIHSYRFKDHVLTYTGY